MVCGVLLLCWKTLKSQKKNAMTDMILYGNLCFVFFSFFLIQLFFMSFVWWRLHKNLLYSKNNKWLVNYIHIYKTHLHLVNMYLAINAQQKKKSNIC